MSRCPLPTLFGAVGGIVLGAGLMLALLVKPIRKLMGGREYESGGDSERNCASEGLDGWLFFDHHRRDPLAYRVLGFSPTAHCHAALVLLDSGRWRADRRWCIASSPACWTRCPAKRRRTPAGKSRCDGLASAARWMPPRRDAVLAALRDPLCLDWSTPAPWSWCAAWASRSPARPTWSSTSKPAGRAEQLEIAPRGGPARRPDSRASLRG